MIINIDMDGVIYDLVGIIKQRLNATHDVDLPDPTSWNFGNWPLEEMGITDVHKWFEEQARGMLFAYGYPIQGAIKGLYDLQGHDLRIVTNKLSLGRSSHLAAMDAIQWLRGQSLLDLVEVVFVRDYDKQGYRADVVIDDNPTLAWAQPGAWNILFDQPWNRDVPTMPAALSRVDGKLTAVQRMYGWDEITAAILA